MYSLVIPVYKNEKSLGDLVEVLKEMNKKLDGRLETVIVVDGSPDRSYEILRELLPASGLRSKLLLLSRNFGSFSAIRAGLKQAAGPYFAVMAADLQEPPELAAEFFRILRDEPCDVVIGTREGRDDPWPGRLASRTFWYLYKKLVLPQMPAGGVDMFGCNMEFKNELMKFEESHSSLISQLFWLGFRRRQVSYKRAERRYGKSAWTLAKKINYLLDSVFAFTDLPIKALIIGGGTGLAMSTALAAVTIAAKITGWIAVPGYAATILTVLFFGALNMLGIGVVGSYAWRAYENTKHRPLFIPMSITEYNCGRSGEEKEMK